MVLKSRFPSCPTQITGNEGGIGEIEDKAESLAQWALRLGDTAYVLEVGSLTLKGDAKTIAKDKNVIKAYLGG